MKKYMDKYVVCPFYSGEHGSKIYCEGFSDSNSLQTSFKTKELLIDHKKRLCRCITRYKSCPLYPIINAKYKEDSQ